MRDEGNSPVRMALHQKSDVQYSQNYLRRAALCAATKANVVFQHHPYGSDVSVNSHNDRC